MKVIRHFSEQAKSLHGCVLCGQSLLNCFILCSALQQFMATYEEFEKWLNATLDDATTRAETKHCVGVTEKKLEEHKVIMYISSVVCAYTYVCVYTVG